MICVPATDQPQRTEFLLMCCILCLRNGRPLRYTSGSPMHKTDLNHQGPPRMNRCSHSNIELRNVSLARDNLDFVAATVMPASLAISFIEASDR
jgi:hypothetical protein